MDSCTLSCSGLAETRLLLLPEDLVSNQRTVAACELAHQPPGHAQHFSRLLSQFLGKLNAASQAVPQL